MPPAPPPTPLADALREAIRTSGLSYSRLAQLAKLGPGTISHFMTGERDMTLGVASRLCAVLGYGLTKVGEAVTKPLADPPKTNRDPKGRRPASAVKRGRGRRVDLQAEATPTTGEAEPVVERGVGRGEVAPATRGSSPAGVGGARGRRKGKTT